MAVTKVLVANRGEIAIRVMRACADLGIASVAVFSDDDAQSLHVGLADEAHGVAASGPRAYLDIERIIQIARDTGCDALHPGYGFLSEEPDLASACADAGIVFVGPSAKMLSILGDKAAARSLAASLDIPVLPGTPTGISVAEAEEFMASLGPGRSMILKAVAGGGGRGQRVVTDVANVAEAFDRCQSEAAAFGNTALLAEAFLSRARHVEVQIIGDGAGGVSHLWDRDCTIQRRHQKLVEIAPAPGIPDDLRASLHADAVRIATALSYQSVGTFEFLVDVNQPGGYFFLEANPRLQVEHTVTEEALGLDLVQLQLHLAGGDRNLADLGVDQPSVPRPRGMAVELRVNMETMGRDGVPRPASGTITAFEVPCGPGVRTDTFGRAGYRVTSRFDSLLAKVVVHSAFTDISQALAKAGRALAELRIDGVDTNASFLQAVLAHPDVSTYKVYTRFVDDNLDALLQAAATPPPEPTEAEPATAAGWSETREAVLQDDWSEVPEAVRVTAGMQGAVVGLEVEEGGTVTAGEPLVVIESMKMEHVVTAPASGHVKKILVAVGDAVGPTEELVVIVPSEVDGAETRTEVEVDLDAIPPALAQVLDRHAGLEDAARSTAVAKRHAASRRTTRENIADLCDPGSFVEHGGLAITPDSGLPYDKAVRRFPGDGLVCGIGSVNADVLARGPQQVAVLSYDYTVLAGTQGPVAHAKTDRLLQHAREARLPVVFFTEGGGGRAGTGGNRDGDTDAQSNGPRTTNMRRSTFATLARLKGIVPTVGINSGRCFAGNAAVLGFCDVIIAAENSNIGMGGPAMIEGAGLGRFGPSEVGPIEVQSRNGVVDIVVEDEAEAVRVAQQYLSYFQGPVSQWTAGDQRRLRHLVPENRLRAYDVREVIDAIADTGSTLELRRHFAPGMVTTLARIEGRPVGIIANNPVHQAGAIDSEGADKAARFMQLLEAFDLPVVVLCDTPGIMVGPEAESTAIVRHASRLFVTGSNLTVPVFMVILRKAYGLGAMAMGGGSLAEPFFVVAWPTAEFAGMGIEGQIRLGYRAELEAIPDPDARKARYNQLVADAYENGKAIHQGETFGVDDVIDPLATRRWLLSGLISTSGRDRSATVPRRIDGW